MVCIETKDRIKIYIESVSLPVKWKDNYRFIYTFEMPQMKQESRIRFYDAKV